MKRDLSNHEIVAIEQFDEMAENYEKGIWGKYFNYSNKKVFEYSIKKITIDSKVLDIGCGPGQMEELVTELAVRGEAIGLDISNKMLLRAKEKHGKASFVFGFADNIPFPENYFDIVYCLNSFHHYPNQVKALKEMFRVLKKDGHLYLLDATRDGIFRKAWTKMLNMFFEEKYVKYYSSKEMRQNIKGVGFKEVTIKKLLYFSKVFISIK